VIAILQFLFLEIQNLDSLLLLGWTSFVFASLAMVSVIDTKKLIANFSIVHVAAALLGTLISVTSEFVSSFSWHHHSVITGLIFWQIGLVYASSGSRLLRWIFPTSTVSLNLVIWFFLTTLSADLPWTSNILIEISLLKSFHDPWIFVSLLFSFWSIFSLAAQSWTSKSQKLVSNSDLEVTNSSGIIFSATAIIVLGFAKSSPLYSKKTQNPELWLSQSHGGDVRQSSWFGVKAHTWGPYFAIRQILGWCFWRKRLRILRFWESTNLSNATKKLTDSQPRTNQILPLLDFLGIWGCLEPSAERSDLPEP
jgi:hypothetical protein